MDDAIVARAISLSRESLPLTLISLIHCLGRYVQILPNGV
jgi:hypothetical protein